MPSKKKLLSQVFLQNQQLVQKLISKSSISKDDVVIEIGPGGGIITKQLAKRAKKVIAIEKDEFLYRKLKPDLSKLKNVDLIKLDALNFEFPAYDYKVFANIPFHIEGVLIRKLINLPIPPKDTYLVMREDVAKRMAGLPKEGQFFVLHSPKFELSIFHYFNRIDFKPKPRVASVMLRMKLREKVLLSPESYKLYENFVKQGFGGGRRIKQNLSPFFSKTKLYKLSQKFKFNPQAKPSDLKFEQWLELFKSWLNSQRAS